MEALFLDFVNSRWPADHDQGAEGLSAADSQALIALRTLLGEAIAALASGAAPAAETLAQLNGHLVHAVVHYALEPTPTGCQAVLRPAGDTATELRFAVVRSFAEFITAHDPGRLRICGNPDCRWVFYDETRNASRRWCGPTCSSLIKVRRYRARHR